MSSFLCFICHSTVNADTNEETREKYREVVGMHLCPDSHLCHICCHVLNRLWLFRSVCLKRSLEYPVLFSEKGTLNLQRNDLEYHSVCIEDSCEHYKSHNINCNFYHFSHLDKHFENNNKGNESNEYCELYEDKDFDDFLPKLNQHIENIIPHINYENRARNFYDEQSITRNNDEQNTASFNDELNKDRNFNDDQPNTVRNFNDELNKYRNVNNAQEITARNYDFEQNTVGNFDVEQIKPGNYDDEQHEQRSFDDEQNNDQEYDVESSDDDFNNEIHDLDDVREEDNNGLKHNNEIIENSEAKVKKKKSKSKKIKKKFEQIFLSIEEQKAELEANKKSKKYIEAEFKCSNCGLGFLFKDTYQTHMMRHEESNGEHRCHICTLRFANPAVLRAHRGLHRERYRCLNCHLLIRKRQRTAHAKECYGIETDAAAACHLCGRVFKDGAGVQQHLKRFHNTAPARGCVCNVCGQRCASHAALRTHMIKHIQKKFPCELCPSVLSSPYTLQQHMNKHTGMPAACYICGVTYTSGKGLKAHARRVHAGERDTKRSRRPAKPRPPRPSRPAVCHLCGAVFKCNSKLNRHLREVCEKSRLEEELASYYAQDGGV